MENPPWPLVKPGQAPVKTVAYWPGGLSLSAKHLAKTAGDPPPPRSPLQERNRAQRNLPDIHA